MTFKNRYTAPNRLASRFNVTKINKVWTLDDTCIPIRDTKRYVRVLHVIDLASRKVLKFIHTTKDFNAAHVQRAVKYLIIQHNIQDFHDEEQRLILHTDRDTHFTSRSWWHLPELYPKKITLSMSEVACPKQNAVSERFHLTLKELTCPILSKYLTQKPYHITNLFSYLPHELDNPKGYKYIINLFISYYNNQHMHRTLQNTPEQINQIHVNAEPLLPEPPVLAVRNNPSSPIEHTLSYVQYKENLHHVYNNLMLIKNDPNIDPNSEYIVKRVQTIVDDRIKNLAVLNQSQFISVSNDLFDIKKTLNKLVERKKTTHVTLPLRDPIIFQTFQRLINAPFILDTQWQRVCCAQFRVVSVLLYITGSRLNEIREFTKKDLDNFETKYTIQTIQTKGKEPRICILGEKAVKLYNEIEPDIHFIFNVCQFKYLGSSLRSKDKAMHPNSWIRNINQHLAYFNKMFNMNLYLKSHSFRIGYVTRNLKVSDIQKAADLIGHKSLNTTRRYNRYLLDDDQNKKILDDGFDITF